MGLEKRILVSLTNDLKTNDAYLQTIEGIAAAVFRFQLWRRWQEIRREWKLQRDVRLHCPPQVSRTSICLSARSPKKRLGVCPCQPDSESYDIRPINGPAVYIVPGERFWRLPIVCRLLDVEDRMPPQRRLLLRRYGLG